MNKNVIRNVVLVSLLSFVSCISLCSASTIKPKPKTDSQPEIPYVTLYGEVTEASAEVIIDKIHQINSIPGNTPILFFIDSPGGEVFAGTKIIDAMLASSRPIYTIDVGLAASMAAYIHSYGTQRFMTPHAVLMFHNASTSFNNDSLNKIASQLIMLVNMMHDLDMNVAKHSTVSYDALRVNEANEWWVLSNEALQDHLIDKIILLSNYPVSIPTK